MDQVIAEYKCRRYLQSEKSKPYVGVRSAHHIFLRIDMGDLQRQLQVNSVFIHTDTQYSLVYIRSYMNFSVYPINRHMFLKF
jgi:hypothetical protein